MATWFNGNVVANRITINYWRTGGDHPPLVLSHGATDSGLCWTRLARALEDDYDVIMPDARGHGHSSDPSDGYSSDDRAADLAGFIRALGLEAPAVGGHSMGAQTTFYLLANYPGLARCAFLEDPVFRPRDDQPTEADRIGRAEQTRQAIAERASQSRLEIIEAGRRQHPTWAEEEFEPWAEAKQLVRPSFAAVRPAERLHWWETLSELTTPVLLITGDPELGGIVTPAVAQEASDINPRLTVAHLAGAGHNIRREQFDGFLGAVCAFLKQPH